MSEQSKYGNIKVNGEILRNTPTLEEILEKSNTTNDNDLVFTATQKAVFESDEDSYTQLLTGTIASNYPFILKVGTRIFVGTYNTDVYEFDESLTLINTFVISLNNEGAWSLSHNTTLNRLYIGGYTGNQFSQYIELSTDTIVNIDNSPHVNGFRDYSEYNPFTDKVYSFDWSSVEIDIYDNGFLYESSIVVTDFNGYVLTTNKQNGKIYLPGVWGGDGKILIYNSAGTLLNTLTYAGESYNIYQLYGATYDDVLNRAYLAINDFIVIVDGSTDLQITTIDLSSYGVGAESITTSNGKMYVTSRVSSTTKRFLIIDTTTFAIEELTTSTGTGQTGWFIADSTNYYIANRPNIEKWSTEKTFKTVSLKSEGTQTQNYEISLPSKSGTVALTSDFSTSKTVWVDATYGNNTTAEKYNFIKPYLTLAAAMTAAVSGDTIYVRPGNYAIGTITLKDGVNIHMINGVNITSGQFLDNSVAVTTKITGNMDIASTSNGTFSITGNGSNVIIECDKYTFNGGGNSMNIQNQCTFQFKCKQYITRGGISFQGGANAIIDIDDVLMAPDSFNQTRRFTDFRGSFSGNVIINFKKLTFGDNGSGFQWLTHLDTIGEGARITLNGEEVISTNQTEATSFEWNNALISPQSGYASSNAILTYRIKRIRTEARQLYVSLGGGNSGTTIILEDINFKRNRTTTNFKGTIRHSRSYDRVIFKNCKISVGSEGEDDNHIVVVGSPTTFNIPGIYAGQVDYLNMEFINCQFIKESLGTDTTALFLLDGENSNISIKNCDIVLSGTFSSPVPHAFDADALLEGNVYFKNTISNIDNSPNIADTALVSGFIGNDQNLTIL